MKPIPACLYGAGALGHTWVVTSRDPDTKGERLALQCSDGPTAAAYFKNHEDAIGIYTRIRRRWKPIRPSAASIA